MKVMKFGGTSVGKPQRMKEVSALVTGDPEAKIVVLSAFSGTTNALVQISELISRGDRNAAREHIAELQAHYTSFTDELLQLEDSRTKAKALLAEHFEFLQIILRISFSEALNKDILAQGELLSTKLFSIYLEEQGISHQLLPALDFMTIDTHDEPQVGTIRVKLTQLLQKYKDCNLFITQGYICRNARGEIDNLKRGGSDYTASLIAAAIHASVCEIWTDIDGMHNNDPRVVEKTYPVELLSFEEAAELAYFGAKILHPASIWPAQFYKVPVKLLNTMDPKARGTLITEKTDNTGPRAVAAKDGITAIRIKSSRMLLAYGFMRKIFEIFEKYRTAVDMVTTSEVGVSITIDNDIYLPQIIKELEEYGTIEIDTNHSIISVVGNEINTGNQTLGTLFSILKDVSVRMVSYGGSRHNISLLVARDQKENVLRLINSGLFGL